MQNSRYKMSPIRHAGLRSALTDKQLRELETASFRKSFNAGQLIFKEGDKTTHSFIVMSGALKLSKIHPNGESHIIGLMFPDDLLCGTFKRRQTCSAEAATDLELCIIPHEAFLNLLEEAPKFERVLFRAALSELEACHDWMLLLRGCTAYQRVAGFLRLLAKRARPKDACAERDDRHPVRFTLPLTRREIACLLDMTEETVSRQMSLMKKQAIIELRPTREVVVPDPGLLAADTESGFRGAGASSNGHSAFANLAGGFAINLPYG